MNRYEAKAIVERTQCLLEALANGVVHDRNRAALRDAGFVVPAEGNRDLESGEIDALLSLVVADEADAAAFFAAGDFSDLYITRSDGGLAPVVRVEIEEKAKIIELPDNELRKFTYKKYSAHGGNYTAPDGRLTHDYCESGPEGVVRGEFYGAASALRARLLEAKAAGIV